MWFEVDTGKVELRCKELCVKQYKEILKSVFGDAPSEKDFYYTLTEVLSECIIGSDIKIEDIDLVDVFCCLLELRIRAIGYSCLLTVTKQDKEATLDFDLRKVFDCLKKQPRQRVIQKGNIRVTLGIPTLKRSKILSDNYFSFMQSIEFQQDGKLIRKEIANNDEAKAVFEKLPPSITSEILQNALELVRGYKDENYLEVYGIDEQHLSFVPVFSSVLWFSKLLFNEPLNVFYDNVYMLSKHSNLSPLYIEQITPGEYIYFTRKLEATLAARTTSSSNSVSQQTDEDFFGSETGLVDEVDLG